MMQPGSPDIGMTQNTPNNMMMQGGGQMSQNFTPEQMAMLQTQRALHGGQGMTNSQNLGGNTASMTPEHIQFAQQMAKANSVFQNFQRQYQEYHQMGQLDQAAKAKEQALAVQRKMTMMKTQMAQRQQMVGNAGSPGINMQQQTPQMGHSHPGFQQQQAHQQMQQMQQQGNMQALNGMTVQQQQQQAIAQQQFAARQKAAQQQLSALMQEHGGQPPPQVIANLPPYLRQMLQQQTQKQQQARAQAQMRLQQGQHPQQQQQQQQQQQNGGVGNEQYVQHLQRMQNQLGMQMQQPHQQQTPGGGMGMPMGMNNMQYTQQPQQQGQGQNDPLNAHFAAMANTLNRGGQGMQ